MLSKPSPVSTTSPSAQERTRSNTTSACAITFSCHRLRLCRRGPSGVRSFARIVGAVFGIRLAGTRSAPIVQLDQFNFSWTDYLSKITGAARL